ncbi:MAG: hypothetical protein AAGB31_02845 [Bdellovibrio sp.]
MKNSAIYTNALQVRQALWGLQKEVLNTLKSDFDRENGYESAPTEWFHVLMGGERYSWLKELTSLMADIDILTELDFITDDHASIARAEIERLITDPVAGQEALFTRHYRELLTSGLSLLPLHSQLKAAVQSLPQKNISRDHAQAERKNWHDEHRHQARKKRN